MNYTDCLALHKPATRGSASITIDTPDWAARLHGRLHGMPLERERYVRLIVGGETVMTDAEFERLSNRKFLTSAKGDCLIAGLGIGLVLQPALERCKSVTVLEVNPDVIALVAPLFPKVTVVQADVRTYVPQTMYDTIYFDIWSGFGEDEVREGRRLMRRYGHNWLCREGWIGSWASEAQRIYARRNR